MIPYIGDISKADSEVLKDLAGKYNDILEFGCGASTQVLSYYSKSRITSIDTSTEWINKTKSNIELLEIWNVPNFYLYDEFDKLISENVSSGEWPIQCFDFIFDDGVDDFRKSFAMDFWLYLKPGGIIAFHDTRRWQDYRNVAEILNYHYNEIDSVKCNVNGSNISIIYKKEKQDYENWQEVENKQQWELGYGDPDKEEVKRRLKLFKQEA